MYKFVSIVSFLSGIISVLGITAMYVIGFMIARAIDFNITGVDWLPMIRIYLMSLVCLIVHLYCEIRIEKTK